MKRSSVESRFGRVRTEDRQGRGGVGGGKGAR